MLRSPRSYLAHLVASAALIILLLAPPAARAASYWAALSSARGEIRHGVSSFVVQSHGGPWASSGSTCTAEAGSYVAGAYCRLRFNVPAGLTAGAVGNGGIARGDYRTSNPYVILRSERPGGNPAGVTDSSGDGAFNHGWQVLGAYVDVGLRVTQATTTTGATNWFRINTFDVLLHDPSVPALHALQAGNGGWNGPRCLPHSYAWSDTGSQVASMSITNLTTGAAVDSWTVPAAGVTTGYPVASDSGCTPAPGTGTYHFRTVANDRAGNSASHDYTVSFDTTLPTAAQPRLDGELLEDGAVIDSRTGYRPTVTWAAVADAHSGIASVSTTFGGEVVAHARTGDTVTLTPERNLPLGTHELRLTVTDTVGNQVTVARTIHVRDDVAPVITAASPADAGGSEPVLDVSASDDYSGLEPSTWTVTVNGATLVASSSNHRLQAEVGRLVDGTHRIVVSVEDRAGNVATKELGYRADSGDELPDPPSLDGIFVFASPSRVESGSTHQVRALVVRAGRPVSGIIELRKGPLVLASAPTAANGAVEVQARISVASPLTLHAPAELGLEPAVIAYELYEPAPADPCATSPRPASCDPAPAPAPAPPPSITNNTTHYHGAPAGGPEPRPAAAPSSGYPRDVVYYVGSIPFWNGLPLAESGARLDRVAPSWRMRLIQHRAGTVQRRRRIAFRLWTTEMAVMSFRPAGSRHRTTISPRRHERTIFVVVARGSRLAARIARARRGSLLTVRIRVVATDKNENRSVPRMRTFRVRV